MQPIDEFIELSSKVIEDFGDVDCPRYDYIQGLKYLIAEATLVLEAAQEEEDIED